MRFELDDDGAVDRAGHALGAALMGDWDAAGMVVRDIAFGTGGSHVVTAVTWVGYLRHHLFGGMYPDEVKFESPMVMHDVSTGASYLYGSAVADTEVPEMVQWVCGVIDSLLQEDPMRTAGFWEKFPEGHPLAAGDYLWILLKCVVATLNNTRVGELWLAAAEALDE